MRGGRMMATRWWGVKPTRVRAGLLLVGLVGPWGCALARRTAVVIAPGECVGVVEFATAGARVRTDQPTAAVGLALAAEVAAELSRRGYAADVLAAGASPTRAAVLRGRVTVIGEGPEGATFWGGGGSPVAVVAVEGSLTAADGGRVDSFSVRRRIAATGETSAEDLLARCVRAAGQAIAARVDAGRARR